VYFAFAAIYVVLSVVFIADVLRQPSTALSGAGKALWIVALLVVPVFAWIVYGIWRMRRSRGLAGL
jgi:Phospholipase_D-nuclease N-terminal